VKDKLDGFGVSVYVSKEGEDSYKGEYRNGQKHGKGMFKWADGVYY
jgi:hypothetical protein